MLNQPNVEKFNYKNRLKNDKKTERNQPELIRQTHNLNHERRIIL